MISIFKQTEYRAWVLGITCSFLIAYFWGGFGYLFILIVAVLLAQSIAVTWLIQGNKRFIWFASIPAFLILLKFTSLFLDLSSDWLFATTYFVVILLHGVLIWWQTQKVPIYWIVFNLLALTITYGLWNLLKTLSLDHIHDGTSLMLVRTVSHALLGLIFGSITFMGMKLSMNK